MCSSAHVSIPRQSHPRLPRHEHSPHIQHSRTIYGLHTNFVCRRLQSARGDGYAVSEYGARPYNITCVWSYRVIEFVCAAIGSVWAIPTRGNGGSASAYLQRRLCSMGGRQNNRRRPEAGFGFRRLQAPQDKAERTTTQHCPKWHRKML